jgi:hypothetical protein
MIRGSGVISLIWYLYWQGIERVGSRQAFDNSNQSSLYIPTSKVVDL